MAQRRLKKELQDFHDDPPEDYSAQPNNDDLFFWKATIKGPEDSPYAGGTFALDFQLPVDYPTKPPNVMFTTKIYHVNVESDGDVKLPILKDDWSPALTISKMLIAIREAMSEPDTDSPADAQVAYQYKTDRDAYEEKAKEWTKEHAT
jgi:ubiquitin-conjugating enzyme E2 D/E